jgi:hypothetical protein
MLGQIEEKVMMMIMITDDEKLLGFLSRRQVLFS